MCINTCNSIYAIFIGGKRFGRTPLNAISPKKTLEGAFAGLGAALIVTVALSRIFRWPKSLLRYYCLMDLRTML